MCSPSSSLHHENNSIRTSDRRRADARAERRGARADARQRAHRLPGPRARIRLHVARIFSRGGNAGRLARLDRSIHRAARASRFAARQLLGGRDRETACVLSGRAVAARGDEPRAPRRADAGRLRRRRERRCLRPLRAHQGAVPPVQAADVCRRSRQLTLREHLARVRGQEHARSRPHRACRSRARISGRRAPNSARIERHLHEGFARGDGRRERAREGYGRRLHARYAVAGPLRACRARGDSRARGIRAVRQGHARQARIGGLAFRRGAVQCEMEVLTYRVAHAGRGAANRRGQYAHDTRRDAGARPAAARRVVSVAQTRGRLDRGAQCDRERNARAYRRRACQPRLDSRGGQARCRVAHESDSRQAHRVARLVSESAGHPDTGVHARRVRRSGRGVRAAAQPRPGHVLLGDADSRGVDAASARTRSCASTTRTRCST